MARRPVVVDGSNLATEGRSLPSLAQLDEAVRAWLAENPEDEVIVVVDASFGYRIDESERKTFEDAEEAGEVVSPPAGALGRGDGFLLRIADRVDACVLSNDSFQEFHGDYAWLFDSGRLMGGKPVPNVGWIFTPRTPVRGPKSRMAVRDAQRSRKPSRSEPVVEAIAEATAEAMEPAVARSGRRGRRARGGGRAAPAHEAINEPLPFITFIAEHPLGTEIEGEVDGFTSHGAFVVAGGARCYVPVSGLDDPPPRTAKAVLRKGEARSFVVQALDPPRRGIELALPGLAKVAGAPTEETVEAEIDAGSQGGSVGDGLASSRRRSRRRAPESDTAAVEAGSPGLDGKETPAAAVVVAATPAAGAAGVGAEDEPEPVPEPPPARARRRPARKAATAASEAVGAEAATAADATEAGDGAPGEGVAPAAPRRRSTKNAAVSTASESEAAGNRAVDATATPARRRRTVKKSAAAAQTPASGPNGPTAGPAAADGGSGGAPSPSPTRRKAAKAVADAPADTPVGPARRGRTNKAVAATAVGDVATTEEDAPAPPPRRRVKKAAVTVDTPAAMPVGPVTAAKAGGSRRRPAKKVALEVAASDSPAPSAKKASRSRRRPRAESGG